jgi:pyruvate dehydrogenase E2 component (dihydrolipoamide acetyltransferase)
MTEGKIVEWVKSPGDKVEKGETVVVVESDKADMDVESFNEGYLAVILVEAGQAAPVGNAIALLAETEAEIEAAKQKAASHQTGSATAPATISSQPEITASTPAAATVSTANTGNRSNGRTVASPRARKLAKELGVDLKTLQGSGPYGRIVALDVEKAAGKTPSTTTTSVATTPSVAKVAATPSVSAAPTATPQLPASITPGETVPLNTLQKAVVQNMMVSLQVPTYHVGYTITTDALDQLYKQIKSKGVTMTALLAKAIAVTLQKHPLLNASYVEGAIKYNSEINVAVAVAMPDGGLITPVLRNADRLDIYSLSRSWQDLVARARVKQLQPDEYSTGTFTLSNLGMFGVDRFEAILPPGQGSIFAVGAARPQIVVNDRGMMGIQRQMSVNITCDHRIIYGSHAAIFLQDLAKLIETEPQSLTL